MRMKAWVRGQITRRLYNEKQIALRSGTFQLAPHFAEIERLGLYLHIPFCRQICPYCPYNKELFQAAITAWLFIDDTPSGALLQQAFTVGDQRPERLFVWVDVAIQLIPIGIK